MGYRIPDTIYDSGVNAFWVNTNDRVAYQRAFNEGGNEQKRISQAMIVANPLTTNKEIAGNMNKPNVPSRFGYDDQEIGITDILSNEMDRNNVHAWNDFSGRDSSYSGTDIPSLPIW